MDCQGKCCKCPVNPSFTPPRKNILLDEEEEETQAPIIFRKRRREDENMDDYKSKRIREGIHIQDIPLPEPKRRKSNEEMEAWRTIMKLTINNGNDIQDWNMFVERVNITLHLHVK